MHLGIIKITYNRTATHFMDNSFMNLGEEVILTLLWQSGTCESATVCFVISLSICYWLFKCWVLQVVCVRTCVCDEHVWWWWTDDEHEQSSMCGEQTRPLLERFSFSSQEPVAAVFGSPVHWIEICFFRTCPIWEPLIWWYIFQADEKHVIQVFC